MYAFAFARGNIKLHSVWIRIPRIHGGRQGENEDGKYAGKKSASGKRFFSTSTPRVAVLRRSDLSKIVSSPSISFPG